MGEPSAFARESMPQHSHIQLRMFGAAVHEQRIAACVNRGTQAAGVFAGKVHVVMIAHVAHNLPAQQAPLSLVQGVHLLEYLRNAIGLQLWKCNQDIGQQEREREREERREREKREREKIERDD